MASQPATLSEHLAPTGPQRHLALNGGGIRGILSLGFLQAIETLLRSRHGQDPNFPFFDYLNLIAGTSTGSIITTLPAQGRRVDQIIILAPIAASVNSRNCAAACKLWANASTPAVPSRSDTVHRASISMPFRVRTTSPITTTSSGKSCEPQQTRIIDPKENSLNPHELVD
jgi:predicted acylesterase/phospholipase RssA